MELTFVKEAIPTITRTGGSGREAEKWEEHLAPLKAEDMAGESFRVWTYDKKSGAISRMTSVRDRLNKAVPNENWKMAVRPLKVEVDAVDSEGAPTGEKTEAEKFGVYIAYKGVFTDEEIAKNKEEHAKRSARVLAAREKAAAEKAAAEATPTDEVPTGIPTEATPAPEATATDKTAKQVAAEKVAAARASKAS